MNLSAALTIRDIPNGDLETLELKMADRKRTRGGDIKVFKEMPKGKTGLTNVKIVFEEESGKLLPLFMQMEGDHSDCQTFLYFFN